MSEQTKKKKLKIAIVILIILLVCSALSLAGVHLYKQNVQNTPSPVVVPDNEILPDEDHNEDTSVEDDTVSHPESSVEQADNALSQETTQVPSRDEADVAISLHRNNSNDNILFSVKNMFPGDVERKNYCVQIAHDQTVTVHFATDIRPGYDILAEVLKCRVVLLTTGDTLYDGLMKDMPDRLTHKLYTASKTTSELYYQVDVYLDTSVGNPYQDTELEADFNWWVEETQHLTGSPITGDLVIQVGKIALPIIALFIIILLFAVRRKGGHYESINK